MGELMQKDFSTRKSLRLKEYDYSTAGAYFITICTKDMRKIFGVVTTDVTVGANSVRPYDIASNEAIQRFDNKADWNVDLATLILRPYYSR